MLSRLFIHRPVLASVIALLALALGALALRLLPVAQYPEVAPPTVFVSATYPGASAGTVELAVTQVVEQQLKGIDGLLYFSSTSSSAGQMRIALSFDQAVSPDNAVIQVQNAVNRAVSRLPQEVQRLGLNVFKSQADQLMLVALYDTQDRMSTVDVSDLLVNRLQDPLNRLPGVGETSVFGAQYAMRIWLDPHRLMSLGLMPSDVTAAIATQNVQLAAGELGARPAPADQPITATVTSRSRMQSVEQFQAIVLRASPERGVVVLSDVARVEMGAEAYTDITTLNGHPAAGMSISLAAGANAVDTAQRVRDEVERLRPLLPPNVEVAYPRDSTPFVKLSIRNVVHTLIEAIGLVMLIMFLFLQNWRATLVPTLTVPVVLLSTFAVLQLAGMSLNTLTLFAMVLAIGLLVDDAIVVVENVERVMHEEKLDALNATLRSMEQISGAVIGITLVLAAVFVPMAFSGGSVGIIYRQFSVTIIAAMALSALVALTLAPALCAQLLRPPAEHRQHGEHREHRERRGFPGGLLQGFFRGFNRAFDAVQGGYQRVLQVLLRRRAWTLLALAAVGLVLVLLYRMLPTGFLPAEDQGSFMLQFSTPVGTPVEETRRVATQISEWFAQNEGENVAVYFGIVGRNMTAVGQNVGMAFATLRPWDERTDAQRSARAVIARANAALRSIRNAQVSVFEPPPVRGLGQSAGFEMWLQDSLWGGQRALNQAQEAVLAGAARSPLLSAVRVNGLAERSELHVDIDQRQASLLGLPAGAINETLGIAWGGQYVNDFTDRGRTKRVYVQGDAPYRSSVEDLRHWHLRGASGQMTPFTAFATPRWSVGPQLLQRFNGVPAVQISGAPSEGHSSGEAMQAMQELADAQPGFGVQWSGLSFQERLGGDRTLMLYLASVLFVFLCLAALYESWSVPIAVMLVVPLGVIGAVVATVLARMPNDVYFQVGLLTTIGLSAKNAILIVEFARQRVQQGIPPMEAALQAARMRLRPIVMTSMAFVAGVLPLVLAQGAGAVSRRAIGISVTGGMVSGTVLAVLMVPVFFLVVQRSARSG